MSGARFRVQRHAELDSTNEHALGELAAGRARHGDVHVAVSQPGGRGRLGRPWHAAPGQGLYMTAVWLPESPLHPAGLTMAAGLAVRDAVGALGVRGALLKWPNDVVVPGPVAAGDPAKLAGVLIESRGQDPTRPHHAIGIGLNVLQVRFPPELLAERPVTSLALSGVGAGVEQALAAVLVGLAGRLDQLAAAPQELADDFVAATGLAGRRLLVRLGAQDLDGVLEGIAAWTGMRLRTAAGTRLVVLEHVTALQPLGA